jgi:hydrogenase/urease accessory protein HupE
VITGKTKVALGASFAALLALVLLVPTAWAHNVTDADAQLIAGKSGWHFALYVWLGAKHMVTGYDHLLFLVGVIFYLREIRSIATFVSLFALGHSCSKSASSMAFFAQSLEWA